MAKISYKERARRRREQEILRTAARMIRDKGYVNLNMDELAEEVGISKPTLYQHFSGKDDMVLKAMQEAILHLEEQVLTLEDGTGMEKLLTIMRYMLQTHADPDGFSVLIMRDPNIALKQLTSDNLNMTDTQIRIGERLYQWIDEAKTEGDIQPDLSPVIVVGMMFSSLSILRGPSIMRDHTLQPSDLIESILTVFKRGVAPADSPPV